MQVHSPSNDDIDDSRRPQNSTGDSPLPPFPIRLGLLFSLLAPFSLVPYLLMRRRCISLQQNVNQLSIALSQLRREAGLLASQQEAIRESHKDTLSRLQDLTLRVEGLRKSFQQQDSSLSRAHYVLSQKLEKLSDEQHSAGINAIHVPPNGDGTTTSQDNEPKLAASPRVGDEQALESHEVIELQAFIDRKAWIEEKIKILEKMPPIEVFVGLEDVRNSALEVSGLPTRVELQQWLVNHDAIEKETEIFDAGEMKKLKKFTKAAAQRNLSPEDTDLIEITLTTIFDLDKLMHLLRDRSEHLDLLDVRLTWEEHRIAAWTEIHTISRETEGFIKTRARWSPTVYDSLSLVEDAPFDPIRRGSIVSTSSAASVNSESSINSVGFSRNARFKFSEQLSKDASKIVSSINNLKHGKLGSSGKALDKLIDASRKPVPDELLDEQDKLEEKGIHGLERLGHFAANLVVQWKKADEIYVETMKDKTSLLNLMEEVETARLRHPHTAQSQLFTTRLDKLKRRLGLRDIPESTRNSFPRPVHPLFPDQGAFNDNLTQILSQELRSTLELLRSVTVIVEGYSDSANVVQGAEILSKSVDDCASSLTSIMDQLVHGVPVGVNGSDGSPPSLLTELSINPTGHSAFFALLPSLLSSLEQLSQRTDQLSTEWVIISLQLEQCGIDTAFRANIASQVQKLCELRGQGWVAAETIKDRSEKLRQTRELCSCIDALLRDVDSLHDQVLQDVERHQWRKVSQYSAPLTPPTPSASLGPSLSSPTDFPALIQQLKDRCLAQVETPLALLSSSHGDALANWISQKSTRLQASLATVTHLSGLLKAVQSQAQVMKSVRAELDSLLLQIEDLSAQQTSRVQDILEDRLSHVEDEANDATFKDDVQSVKSTVQTFLSELTTRVPFVSHDSSRHTLRADSIAEVPSPRSFDTIALDAAVRAECNTYAMRVSGEMEALQQASNHVHLARLAKRVDAALSATFNSINDALSQSTAIKQSLPSVNNEHTFTSLQLALQQVEDLTAGTSLSILRSFSPIQDLIRQMDTVPTALDPTIYKKIYLPRRRAVDDAELRFTSWKESLEALKLTILHAQSIETKRLQKEQVEQQRIQKERDEQLRLAEEIRLQAEQKQAIAEAAEVERLRREHEEEEERSQLEEARRILKRERERFAIDSAENLRIEQEHRATIQRLRDEEARLREVHDRQVAEGRLAVEEANKSRREHERQASLKIKQIQEELRAEEERLRLKKERIAEEMLRTDRSANIVNKTQFVINDDGQTCSYSNQQRN
ncbi:hypothetical protein ONZ45_g18130 [Pleurotus djamor]|nr:hypothetical protein ONZ45_g18130 [Pleurotus djamor]